MDYCTTTLHHLDGERANPRIAETDHGLMTPSTAASDHSALAELPQDPASIYAERIETYWLPEARALPTVAPAMDDAFGKLLTQIDGLAINIADGENLKLDKAQASLRASLATALADKQQSLFPQMRKRYAEGLDAKLFRRDIRVEATGSRSTTLRITGAIFVRNANVEDMQNELSAAAYRLRFRRIEYRWSRYITDSLYYDLSPPADAKVGSSTAAP